MKFWCYNSIIASQQINILEEGAHAENLEKEVSCFISFFFIGLLIFF